MSKLPYAIAGVAAVVIFILLLLLFGRPNAEVTGQCSSDCTYPVKSATPSDSYDSATICGSGCFIKSINYSVGYMSVTCACCQCVTGDIEAGLGECEYGPGLNWLGAAMGLCRLPAGD